KSTLSVNAAAFVAKVGQSMGKRFHRLINVLHVEQFASNRPFNISSTSQPVSKTSLSRLINRIKGRAKRTAPAASMTKVSICSQIRGHNVLRKLSRSCRAMSWPIIGHLTEVHTAERPD